MSRKNVKTPSKSKISVSDILFKTTFGIPIFMTNLLYHTGEAIIDKSLAFLSGAQKDHPMSAELLSELHSNKKKDNFAETSMDTEEVFGMRPYGPKIYIRK